jgi:hypothetical protein
VTGGRLNPAERDHAGAGIDALLDPFGGEPAVKERYLADVVPLAFELTPREVVPSCTPVPR